MIQEKPSPTHGPLSNDNFFKSNFSAWSYCAVILRTKPDWSVVTSGNFMFDVLAALVYYINKKITSVVEITFVDESQNISQ